MVKPERISATSARRTAARGKANLQDAYAATINALDIFANRSPNPPASTHIQPHIPRHPRSQRGMRREKVRNHQRRKSTQTAWHRYREPQGPPDLRRRRHWSSTLGERSISAKGFVCEGTLPYHSVWLGQMRICVLNCFSTEMIPFVHSSICLIPTSEHDEGFCLST